MWVQTDELQFVKTVNENEFEIIETIDVAGEFYVVDWLIIDLDEYDLESEVKGYYDSLEEVKSIYNDDWRMIVAEIIAENHASISEGTKLNNLEEVKDFLKNKYGITVQ